VKFGEPSVEERDAGGFEGGESDTHAGEFAAIGDPALSQQDGSCMGDADVDLRSRGERGDGLDETPQYAEVLSVSGDMGVAVESSHLHSGHEGKTSGAMGLEGDGGTLVDLVVHRILCQRGQMSTETANAGHQ
jgi:hypothetical protein